jgi:hypothetical protein
MDTVINSIMLKDKSQMNRMAGYIETTTTENFKCVYNGSLHFFKRNMVVQHIDFYTDDVRCMHFFY